MGEVKAIRGVDFSVDEGESVGVVGESGSGKSVTSLSVMRLLPYPGRVTEGEILLRGENILSMSSAAMRALRGDRISMIFQDPMTSLNPVFTIGDQIIEAMAVHGRAGRGAASRERAAGLLELVGIPEASRRAAMYPHEFSGGMRQRAMIAMALSCGPELLIADEPTTALDVTIQAQILDLMTELKLKTGTSVILITHDLGVVSETCSRIIVMYGGQIMEESPSDELFENPLHPYTRGLLRCVPANAAGSRKRLAPIPGTPPDLISPPEGCPFAPRCQEAMRICHLYRPGFYLRGAAHRTACWKLDEEAPR
ncbi:MAG: ABC transporter ATP-binding protein [Synergistaceae bacterium]|nr:ABC transporter ATP-binding protein [Synergistaceae bacterium]